MAGVKASLKLRGNKLVVVCSGGGARRTYKTGVTVSKSMSTSQLESKIKTAVNAAIGKVPFDNEDDAE